MSILQQSGRHIMTETAQISAVVVEDRERAQIEARRARAEERRQRFLNARERTIGLDTDYLDRQVAEKEAAAAAAKAAEQAYAANQAAIERQLARVDVRIDEGRKAESAAIAQSWKHQEVLRKATEDYRALQDPDALKKDRPARIGDEDPLLGPSSMQKFDGEDLKEAERRSLQAEQMRHWVAQQKSERVARLVEEIKDDRAYAAYLRDLEVQREAVDKMIADAKAAEEAAAKAENDRLVRQRAERAKAEKLADAAASKAELEAALSKGGLLAENPEDAVSALGPNRIRRDHYRGMSAAQAAAYQNKLKEQMALAAAKRAEEKQREQEEAAELRTILRTTARAEALMASAEARKKQEYIAQLNAQREEQAARARADKEDELAAGFSDGFFGGFGRSDR